MGASSAGKLNLVQTPQVSSVPALLWASVFCSKKNVSSSPRDPRFWMAVGSSGNLRAHSKSWELMCDESCSGDFIGDSDLIPLAHSNAKQTAKNMRALGTVTPGMDMDWKRGWGSHRECC